MRPGWLLAVALAPFALASASAAAGEVALRNGVFDPAELVVAAGDTLTFVNHDGRPHTVTSTWDEGRSIDALLRPGDAVPVTFAEAGRYVLRCTPHAAHESGAWTGMVATVAVEGAAAAQAPVRTVGTVLAALVTVGVLALIAVRGAGRAPTLWRRG